MPRPLAAHSIIDALADALRERILSGDLPGGSAVTETQLAVEYGVARPTAKSAIERTAAAGLLKRGPHKRATVPVLGVAEVRDLYFARGCVEAEGMRRLALERRVPPAAVEAIAALDAAWRAAGSLADLVEPDVRFHRELINALGSQRMTHMHGLLMTEMRLCMAQVQARGLLSPPDIVAEHQEIIRCIEDGNPESAAAAGVAHLDRACVLLADGLDGAGSAT